MSVKVVETVRRHELDPEIRENVEKGSEVSQDKFHSYEKLADEYVHQVIDHAECYAKGTSTLTDWKTFGRCSSAAEGHLC